MLKNSLAMKSFYQKVKKGKLLIVKGIDTVHSVFEIVYESLIEIADKPIVAITDTGIEIFKLNVRFLEHVIDKTGNFIGNLF